MAALSLRRRTDGVMVLVITNPPKGWKSGNKFRDRLDELLRAEGVQAAAVARYKLEGGAGNWLSQKVIEALPGVRYDWDRES